MRRLLQPLILAAALLACDDEGPATPADIVVAPNVPRVPAGDTEQLTATVVDAGGRAIEGYPVTFHSSDVSVLTVSRTGLLRSVGPLGTSIITVEAGGVAAEVEATVVLGPSTLVVTPERLEMLVGEQMPLTITVTDEDGNVVESPELLFRTPDPEVAQVSADRQVMGLGQGFTEITITCRGLLARISVLVTEP